jgi:hypothetical protein
MSTIDILTGTFFRFQWCELKFLASLSDPSCPTRLAFSNVDLERLILSPLSCENPLDRNSNLKQEQFLNLLACLQLRMHGGSYQKYDQDL